MRHILDVGRSAQRVAAQDGADVGQAVGQFQRPGTVKTNSQERKTTLIFLELFPATQKILNERNCVFFS